MNKLIDVTIPDIGDFRDVPIIEVLVKPGDKVAKEDPLVTLESDKATMDIPAPQAGVVKELRIKTGDKVSEGSLILTLEAVASVTAETAEPLKPTPVVQAGKPGSADIRAEVVVLGAGPGGYTAAFRAADLGKQVVLIERYSDLGGVCLNVGCIPSKALLHVAKVISEAEEMARQGVNFGKPEIETDKLRGWKQSVTAKLSKGLAGLARQRKVQVVQGVAQFASPNMMQVQTRDGGKTVSFDYCIIAAGSQAAKIPGYPDDLRIMDSTSALQIRDIPPRLLVIGGGIIGLELACVYDALGSKISVVELLDGLMLGADRDLIKPLQKRIEKRYEGIYLNTEAAKIEAQKDGLKVHFDGNNAPKPQLFDRVLVAVGRKSNGKAIGAENAGVQVTDKGIIPVDKQMRTNVPHIFAIGDIVGEPMLAHKASHEGRVAAEVIAGHKVAFDARTIPSVAYTDPEVAWMGFTEIQASEQGIEFEKAVFPWAASGRALAQGRDEGMSKLLFDKSTNRLLGAGIVGPNAGELISETVLALEMGADAQDIALTIHPHPTLSETVFFSAEVAEGTVTDLYIPKK
ncbi:MAG TPA: dihydrolipoyl dehydrogenase [Burkholderiales bacterium]|nr:dihydrolipoyl dehydrogenase [Burkholderiales bacterium]